MKSGVGFSGRLGLKERIRFYHQLRVRLSSGMPVLKALDGMAATGTGRVAALSAALRAVHGNWNDLPGVTQSAIPVLEKEMWIAGERSGKLPEFLGILEREAELVLRFRSKIFRACVYPVAVLHLAVFLAPASAAVARGSLEWYFINVALLLVGIYLAALGLWVLGIFFQKAMNVSPSWERFVFMIPWIGGFFKNRAALHFSRTVGMFLESGAGVLGSLRQASVVVDSPSFRTASRVLLEQLQSGASLSPSLATLEIFPSDLVDAFHTGESSGRLAEELLRVSRFFQAECESFLEQLAAWAPRVLYFLVAVFVVVQIFRVAMGYFAAIGELLNQ